MGNYLNAYELLSEVRKGINEYSAAYVQGTDTTGAFDNADIMKKINDAQGYIYNGIINQGPDVFFKTTTLTGVNSVYTLPADFYRMRRVENSDGVPLRLITMDIKRMTADTGTGWWYWYMGNTFILDKLNATDVLTIFYSSRCRSLDAGSAQAGGALSITLATTAKKRASYYNGMQIENFTKDWTDTISAYATTRVATIAAQTAAAADYYGLVSELPEDFHELIGPKAILLMKETHKALKPPTATEQKNFLDNMAQRFNSFFGTFNSDQDIAELFF